MARLASVLFAVGLVMVVIAAFALTHRPAAPAPPRISDEQIEQQLDDHMPELLYTAVALEQRKHGMTFGFDMWWRLSEGRWTTQAKKYLPELTDASLLEFLKRYGAHHAHDSVEAIVDRMNARAGWKRSDDDSKVWVIDADPQ